MVVDMILTFIVMLSFWLLGVYTAWFQIQVWKQEKEISFPTEGCEIMMSLLSWGVFAVHYLEKLSNRLKN